MEIKQKLIEKSKYYIKCPYEMKADFIIVHNTANDASAEKEITYMQNNNSSTSFHIAVDDIEVMQGIGFGRNTWNCGDGVNGKGNRNGISIEICYSKSGGEKWEKAKENAIKLIVKLLKENNWGIDKVKKHQDFNGKYCPHRILDEGWDKFLNRIKEELGEKPKQENVASKINVKYQVYAGKWYSDITNYNDINNNGYAGVYGQAISGFRGNTVGQEETSGKLVYRVHIKNDKWLGEITDRQKDSFGDDFAGMLGKPIDAIMIKSSKGTARYRVHLLNGKWLPWITGYNINDNNNGYAGILSREIDAIQVEII